MEGLLVLLVLYLIVVLLVLPIWTFIKIRGHSDAVDTLRRQIIILEEEIKNLRTALRNAPGTAAPAKTEQVAAAPTPVVVPAPSSAPISGDGAPPPRIEGDDKETGRGRPVPNEGETLIPPPLPAAVAIDPVISGLPEPVRIESASAAPIPEEPPPLLAAATVAPTTAAEPPQPPPVYVPPPPKPSWTDNINWEQFMGAKLFAWLGGLALFLGVAFFVKYSFEHGWVPPEVRAGMGFVFGAALVVGGLKLAGDKYRITSQTLVATGIVSLYAVTFACRSIYKFEFFGPLPTFLVMSLITVSAFVLAVRLEAQVVAVLGILGGFLTPKLLSTGVDNPLGLFGYVALLDLGLIAVALHRRWFYLVPLGAAGTIIMEIGWADQFYAPEKTGIAMSVCLGFSALFIAAVEAAQRWARPSPLLGRTAIALPATAFGFAWYFLDFPSVASRTELYFGFVILTSLLVFTLAWRDAREKLVAGAAAVTTVLLIGWTDTIFTGEQAATVAIVCLVFCALHFGAYLFARWKDIAVPAVMWSAVAMPLVAFGFAFYLLNHPAVDARPGLIFSFILLADVVLLALAWLDERLPRLHLLAGLAVFALLSNWTAQHLTETLLPWALAVYLLFAALHTVFPLLLERKRPASAPTWWSQLFPPLTLLLMLLPIVKLPGISMLIWPAILLVDLLAIVLAMMSASLLAVGAVLVLTLLATGACLFKVPVAAVIEPSLLIVIGGFAIFFFAASFWLVKRLGNKIAVADNALNRIFGDARAQLPAFSSLLPFLLLIMACSRLTIPNPAALFGLGLLLVILTLGLARLLVIEWLPACALAGMAALEHVWHARQFSPDGLAVPLFSYLVFYGIFAVYPFVFQRTFVNLTGPWAVAALSGVLHFPLVYKLVNQASPNGFMGLIPAAFSLAPLGSLLAILKTVPADNPRRLNQLAWFGGVTLFFITLIFPVQFERQWLTVAWALEGAALLWLFHRVPHRGLPAVGAVLLVTAFVRLALNPAVLAYHVRSATPIFNWYLYAYGLTVIALFAGAYLAAPPRERILGVKVPPLFQTLGTVLAFLLLNIEIADYFTVPGARTLTFQFSGNFARDMSYTIGWALFALGLLGAGIWKDTRAARYAALALLGVALAKLFFHDLIRLDALYRIGAFFAVAVIAILASVAYQRFLPGNAKTPPPQP